MFTQILTALLGAFIVLVVLWDSFETIVLPRRVVRRYRLARYFFRSTWLPYRSYAQRLRPKQRERLLSFYGPLSLLALISLWALGMVVGFAFLHHGVGSQFGNAATTLGDTMYFSGTTFFTLGLGDVVPHNTRARVLSVMEAGMGFGFLALVIGYFPVLYQAFSRREVQISLLDARAGSPPTAHELLARSLGESNRESCDQLVQLLADWERWSAELMESHLSYPVLCYFRSQHDNESWLAALTALLDVCALIIANTQGRVRNQAILTFAIARHAIVDLSQVFWTAPLPERCTRLRDGEADRLRMLMLKAGMTMRPPENSLEHLDELRRMYEPFVMALSRFLLMPLPDFEREHRPDNWQTSAWGRITSGQVNAEELRHDDHM